MQNTRKIAAIGECMIELSVATDGSPRLSYGGDTLNTAVYLARLLGGSFSIDYITAVGDDPYSEDMIGHWEKEGIGIHLVNRISGRLPGLYTIRTDRFGERSFYYWRDRSAAKDMFAGKFGQVLYEKLLDYDLIYLSGITLCILNETYQRRLFSFLDKARSAGSVLVFDSNYRPSAWSDGECALKAMNEMMNLTDIALPSLSDETQLRGIDSITKCLRTLAKFGVSEICVKDGANGCAGWSREDSFTVTAVDGIVIDTTAAGDAFNAGYLSMRVRGYGPHESAIAASKLAKAVISHQGAIIPIADMPELL